MARDNPAVRSRALVAVVAAGVLGGLLYLGALLVPSALAARDASGTYTRPTGQPVVAGTTITASAFNTYTADVATEITDSLSRSGKGGMTAALGLANGSVGTPAVNFTSDTDTGLYRIGANNLGVAVGGAKVLDVAAASVTSVQPVLAPNGAIGAPAYSFTNDADSGLYRGGAGDIRLSVDGVDVLKATVAGGVVGTGTTSQGVSGVATSGTGVAGTAGTGNGGDFSSTSGYGAQFTGNATKAPLKLVTQAAPSTIATGAVFADTNGAILTARGGAAFVPIGAGVCFDRDYNAVGNVGAGEDDLQTATLPANYLTGTFRLEFKASGSTANNANAKTLKVYFGGTAVLTAVLTTSIAADWLAELAVYRTGASTQRYVARVDQVNQADGTVKSFVAQGTLAITETAGIVIKTTGTATSDNDVVQNTYALVAL